MASWWWWRKTENCSTYRIMQLNTSVTPWSVQFVIFFSFLFFNVNWIRHFGMAQTPRVYLNIFLAYYSLSVFGDWFAGGILAPSTLVRTFQSKSRVTTTVTCFVCFIYPVRFVRRKMDETLLCAYFQCKRFFFPSPISHRKPFFLSLLVQLIAPFSMYISVSDRDSFFIARSAAAAAAASTQKKRHPSPKDTLTQLKLGCVGMLLVFSIF